MTAQFSVRYFNPTNPRMRNLDAAMKFPIRTNEFVDWVYDVNSIWTSSAPSPCFRDLMTSLNLRTRFSRSFPGLRVAPVFDATYRTRANAGVKAQYPTNVPEQPAQHHLLQCDYQYRPIPHESIRLLRLEPGSKDEPISCSLVVCAVDDLPNFEAISYTWGDISASSFISCHGLSLKIHSNALHALLDLRPDNEPRILWVDAICINQQDSGDTAARYNSFTQADLRVRELPYANNQVWKALDALLWSSWFSRTWIIQEISLARETVLISGAKMCPWDDIKNAAYFISSHSLTVAVNVDPSQVLRLESMVETFRNEGSILELAQLARASKATDPRDKIYGLLGLALDGHDLVPNYLVNAQESYTTLAVHLIQQRQSLALLNSVEHYGNFAAQQEIFHKLPSWVPNWTLSGLAQPLPTMAQLEHSVPICAVSPERFRLEVQGIELGIIKDAGDTFIEFVPRPGNSVPEILVVDWIAEYCHLNRWRQWDRIARKVSAYPTGEAVRTAYIRTLVANTRLEKDSSVGNIEQIYDAWLRFWRIVGTERGKYLDYYISNTSPEDTQRAFSFMAAHKAAAYGRCFFVTREGYFGLGPFQTRKGDRVVALCGGKTPYMLRYHGGKGVSKEWKILGECYLHGVKRDILHVNTNYQTITLR